MCSAADERGTGLLIEKANGEKSVDIPDPKQAGRGTLAVF